MHKKGHLVRKASEFNFVDPAMRRESRISRWGETDRPSVTPTPFFPAGRILCRAWERWSSNTSVAGAGSVSRESYSFLRRSCWAVIFVAGLVLTGFSLAGVLADYREYQVASSITMDKWPKLKFPAVTACNLNRIDCFGLLDILTRCDKNITDNCDLEAHDELSPLEVVVEKAWDLYRFACVAPSSEAAGGEGGSDGTSGGGGTNNGNGNNDTSEAGGTSSGGNSTGGGGSTSGATGAGANSTDGEVAGGGAGGSSGTGSNSTGGGTSGASSGGGAGEGTSGGGGGGGSGTTGGSTPTGRKKRSTQSSSSSNPSRHLKQEDLGDLSVTETYEMEFMALFSFFKEGNRLKMGHGFEHSVTGCTFKQRDCRNETNFLVFNTAAYGNCFTFNSALSTTDSYKGGRVSTLTGPKFGLTLVVNTEQPKYMQRGITREAGIRVAIHDSREYPLMEEFGFSAMTSTLTSLAVTETAVDRREAPFVSNCVDSWEGNEYARYVPKEEGSEIAPGWGYNMALCTRICLFDLFLTTCNCTHANYADSDTFKINRPCDLHLQDVDYECVNSVYDSLDNDSMGCGCGVDCREKSYSVSTSTSQFPAEPYSDIASVEFAFMSDVSNISAVSVYYSSFTVQHVTEIPIFETWYSSNFLSALGGALSLYLGISLAMFFELVEFFIELAVTVHHYVTTGKV